MILDADFLIHKSLREFERVLESVIKNIDTQYFLGLNREDLELFSVESQANRTMNIDWIFENAYNIKC